MAPGVPQRGALVTALVPLTVVSLPALRAASGRPRPGLVGGRAGARYRPFRTTWFPGPLLRTGHACLHASGSPQAHAGGLCRCLCRARPWCRDPCSSVAIPGDGDLGGVGKAHPALRRPPVWQVAAPELLPGGAGMLVAKPAAHPSPHIAAQVVEGGLGYAVPEVAGPAPQHQVELGAQGARVWFVVPLVSARTFALTATKAFLDG
jgi:hypothetical protein